MNYPKGTLIAIGGGEDKRRKMNILNRFLLETGKKDPYIEVVTTATNEPEEVGRDYTAAFEALNVKNFHVMHMDDREQANSEEMLKRLERADGVLFSGGDQLRLSTILGGTTFCVRLKDKYQKEKFVIAGTSAGAAAMSSTMIISGSSRDAFLKGDLSLTAGLSLIPEVIIDTHYTQRGRFGRLVHVISSNPAMLGLGLGEDTGAVIKNGKELEVVGSGLAILIDGMQLKYTNIAEIKDGEPITVDNLILHVLANGNMYDMEKREFIKEVPEKLEKQREEERERERR